MRPSKLSSRPMTSTPALYADFTTARITAFSPGASPPPVRTPIFFIFGMGGGYGGRRGVAWRVTGSIAVALACHALSPGHNNVVTADLRRQRRRKFDTGATFASSEREGWWTARGSNSRPPHCERGALPTELAAHCFCCVTHPAHIAWRASSYCSTWYLQGQLRPA